MSAPKIRSVEDIPEHLQGSFALIEEMNGARAALHWLRAQYAAAPSDALRAHSLRSAKGCADLDAVRSACPFPRVSTRKSESTVRKVPSLFNQS